MKGCFIMIQSYSCFQLSNTSLGVSVTLFSLKVFSKVGVEKVETSTEQLIFLTICGKPDSEFASGQPQSADPRNGLDWDLAAIWKIGHFMLSDSRGKTVSSGKVISLSVTASALCFHAKS